MPSPLPTSCVYIQGSDCSVSTSSVYIQGSDCSVSTSCVYIQGSDCSVSTSSVYIQGSDWFHCIHYSTHFYCFWISNLLAGFVSLYKKNCYQNIREKREIYFIWQM